MPPSAQRNGYRARASVGGSTTSFGYFALTLMFCFIWGRPFLLGGALMAAAVLFEGLQAFTPDRHADFYAACASGAMAAILPADFFIRAPTRTTGRALEMISRSRASSL